MPQLPTIRLAAKGGDRDQLADLSRREAPIKIVAPLDDPNLLWDPLTHEVTDGTQTIAVGIQRAELPAVVDRTAVVRVLQDMQRQNPQSFTLSTGRSGAHSRQKISLEFSDMAGRALHLFDIDSAGNTELLFPIAGDDPIAKTASRKFEFVASPPPFGTHVLLAVSTSAPIKAFEMRPHNSSQSATDLLRRLKQTLPNDGRVGLATMAMVP